MYYKKIEHFKIILCLIKLIALVLLNVSEKATASEDGKIFSAEQLSYLAESVCSDLIFINETTDSCVENFWGPGPTPKLSTALKIRCQTRGKIKIQIVPSEKWQLIVLAPQSTNDSDTNDADLFAINYVILEPYIELEEISTVPHRNYTIWSTTLEKGTPQMWRGGDNVPLFNKSMAIHRRYDIKHQFRANADDPSVVDGWFTWNTTGDGDVCFDVANLCKEDDLKKEKVWPNNNNNGETHVTFNKLSVNDECQIEVIGMYGTTKLRYHTPTCDYDCLSTSSLKPEIPQNIFIRAIKDAFNKWEVRVSWSAPLLVPDSYNVTLRSSTIQTVVLSGNETETVFKDVVGEGLYNVTVGAVLGRITGITSRLAIFPERSGGGTRRGGAAVAALAAGVAAATALALLCRCRRSRSDAPSTPYKPDPKRSKDGETEVLEVWTESEDRWEMRADKLVLHEVIGEGAFGVVRRATLAPHSQHVAVKMLKDFPSLEEIRSFRSEMELMKSVGVHPHLVNLVGCCSGRRPFIIEEYCSRGDLLSYLRCAWDVMLSKRNAKYYNNNIVTSDYRNDLFKCKAQMEHSKLVVNKLYDLQEICDKEITPLDLLSFCRQIAMGMEFLAANRVVHRDLAARNILVTADRTLKIADFGLSRDVYEENQYKQKGNGKMPVKWMALESLTRRVYTTQSDVWSFGVVMWEISTVGDAPYAGVPGGRLPRLLRSGYRMPRPNNCSSQLYDIMLSCWRTHPRDRPTFAELHKRIDELLNSACANQYLSLELDADDVPPTPSHHRYIKMLIRGKRNWARGENYERPLKAPNTNHYTSPPDASTPHVTSHAMTDQFINVN